MDSKINRFLKSFLPNLGRKKSELALESKRILLKVKLKNKGLFFGHSNLLLFKILPKWSVTITKLSLSKIKQVGGCYEKASISFLARLFI